MVVWERDRLSQIAGDAIGNLNFQVNALSWSDKFVEWLFSLGLLDNFFNLQDVRCL